VVAVISVFSAKDDFNAARMIARPICPAAASATTVFSTAVLSPAVFAKVTQHPLMIFWPHWIILVNSTYLE
jgi:hypothetical protein